MKHKDSVWKFLIILVTVVITITLHAEDAWIGKWKSDPIQVDTETMTMIFEFKDSTNMVMGFETDNIINNVGQCISDISVNGTYEKIGPIFITHIDEKSLKAEIKRLHFDKAFKEKAGAAWIDEFKKSMKTQILTNAENTFTGYDGGTMIYVTHDDPNVFSFIFGYETNAMDLKFTRIN